MKKKMRITIEQGYFPKIDNQPPDIIVEIEFREAYARPLIYSYDTDKKHITIKNR